MSEQKSTVFGIDLGTTYSCIAHIDEYGRPATIPNAEGDRTTPSVVFFEGQNRIVGKEAKKSAVLYPKQVVAMVKREMGHGEWVFSYDGTDYKPEEISSYILRKLVNDAEMALNCEIKDVVITCPAYFGINERAATVKAGETAHLNVRSIINEPTAAAISYGLHQEKDQVVLVYDLGGGTFDITMIEIKTGEINVIATGGDHFLGGRNWDEVIVNYLSEKWKLQTGSADDPVNENDLETLQDLWGLAEEAKKSLTAPAREKTDVSVTHHGQREKIVLTREKFDELTAHLLERTIEYTRQMLEEAKKKGYERFDKILLVGGSTRMPQVIARLKNEFKIDPEFNDPDESVAKGAAWYGQKLAVDDAIKIKIASWGLDDTKVDEVTKGRAQKEAADELGLPQKTVEKYNELTIRNVTSRSFGVVALDKTRNEIVRNIIKKNDSVPTKALQTFGTVEANQENAEIRIMENIVFDDIADLSASAEIGNAVLDLPSGLPMGAKVEITFQLDEQGRLHAVAREVSANRVVEVEIQTTRVISDEELEEAKSRSTQLSIS